VQKAVKKHFFRGLILTGAVLREKRMEAGIAGSVLCCKAAIGRSRLCAIERGYIAARNGELRQLFSALNELVTVRRTVRKLEVQMGWPVAAQAESDREQEDST
jgi:hypothetical protein